MVNWLRGKTVVITGASSGMGKEITLRLLKQLNCNVIGIARSREKMDALTESLGGCRKRFSYRLFDVSVKENWDNFALEMREKQIKPDVLINNAGILPPFKRFDRFTDDEINRAMNINFFSCVYSIRSMLPLLLESPEPGIINVSSSASLMSLAGTSMYSASKSALKALTEALREEMRGKCYVGLVCPGFTKTDIFREQSASGGEKALNMISTSCGKMVDRIMFGIARKQSLMIYGTDAWFMKVFGRIMPVSGTRLFSLIMKKSKLALFDEIFK